MFRYILVLLLALTAKPGVATASPELNDGWSEYHKTMYRGVLANRGYYSHITPEYARRLINEVIEITSKPENSWMEPHILLGLAMNESDLRWWVITGRGSIKDCGVCQNHVPLFSKYYRGRMTLCKRLARSTKLSFHYAMLELNVVRNKWCLKRHRKPTCFSGKRCERKQKAWKNNMYRCTLNLYNQGPRYFGRIGCRLSRIKNETNKRYYNRVRKCLYRNRYWVRSLCFSRGLELGRKPKRSCRCAYSLSHISILYRH